MLCLLAIKPLCLLLQGHVAHHVEASKTCVDCLAHVRVQVTLGDTDSVDIDDGESRDDVVVVPRSRKPPPEEKKEPLLAWHSKQMQRGRPRSCVEHAANVLPVLRWCQS